MMSPNIINSNV